MKRYMHHVSMTSRRVRLFRWLDQMKELPSGPRINEALYGLAKAVEGLPHIAM